MARTGEQVAEKKQRARSTHSRQGKRGFQARRKARYGIRRAMGVVLLLAAAAVAYLAFSYLSNAATRASVHVPASVYVPEGAARAPALASADEPKNELQEPGATEDGWTSASALERSPSLAAPGETMRFDGRVALTFDDGPTPDVTPAVLEVLREHDVRATFFVVGKNVAEHPAILRSIVREGHALGNHTYSHADLSELGPGQVREELRATQEAVDEALGYHYPLAMMRPPYGEPYFGNTGALPGFRKVMRQQGMYPVMWTMDSNDLRDPDSNTIVRNVKHARKVLDREENDGVLLMHDLHRTTAEALPAVISYYAESGFEFTGTRELLAEKYGVEPAEIQPDPQQPGPGS